MAFQIFSILQTTLGKQLLVAGMYVLLGRIALLLAVPPGYAMAIYPPAGLALAAVLVGGKRLSVGVGLGSLFLNLWIGAEKSQELTQTALILAVVIACGAMLQACLGAAAIKKVVGYPLPLDNNQSILQFMLLGGVLGCTVNSAVGVGALYFFGIVNNTNLFENWFTWWLGDSLGVLIVTPIGLILFGQPASIWRARRFNVMLPLLVTLMLVVMVFAFVRNWEQTRLESEFRDRAERVANALQARLDYHLEVQKSVVSLFVAVDSIAEDQFTRFVAQPISNYSAMRAIAWLPRIPQAQREKFETRDLASTGNRREILDIDSAGTTQAASKRAEYFPIAFVSPLLGNSHLPGVDLTRLEAVQRAAEEARDIGLVVASGPLAKISGEKYVAALVSPVYDSKQSTATVEARKTAQLGLIISLLDLNDVVESVLGGHDKSSMLVRLSDTPETKFDYINTVKVGQIPAKAFSFNLNFAGRSLNLVLVPSQDFLAHQQAWAAWVALVGGMLFAGIVGMYLLVVSGRSFGIEELVIERTGQLHESEQRLLAILDNAADGILTVDQKGSLVLSNRALCQLFNFAPSTLNEHFFDTLFLENGRPLLVEQVLPTISSGRVIKNVQGRHADGHMIPLELAITEVGMGERRLYIVIVHDLTERHRVDQLKGEFVSAVSHELRTPLTSIRGSLGLLVGGVCGKLPDKMDKLVRLANDNADRLAVLINDLLDFEKLEVGGMHFHFAVCDLHQIVRQALEINQGYAQKFTVTLNLQADLARSIVIYVDEGRMIQVLSNLISNAIKFSHPQGQVDIKIERQNDRAKVIVTDFGTGIPDEFKHRIFEKFSQADGSVSKKYSGTGLGLSIAKMMVEKMGGEIGFVSEEGRGASFFVQFPISSK